MRLFLFITYDQIIIVCQSTGGRSPGSTSAPLPDWVDASVAGWIKNETAAMEAAWDSIESRKRGALAFMHIPPYVALVQLFPNTYRA